MRPPCGCRSQMPAWPEMLVHPQSSHHHRVPSWRCKCQCAAGWGSETWPQPCLLHLHPAFGHLTYNQETKGQQLIISARKFVIHFTGQLNQKQANFSSLSELHFSPRKIRMKQALDLYNKVLKNIFRSSGEEEHKTVEVNTSVRFSRSVRLWEVMSCSCYITFCSFIQFWKHPFTEILQVDYNIFTLIYKLISMSKKHWDFSNSQ